ncbi:MAG: saccharopine dehydrogenase NADP-binding domain-containing protein, partial [Actinobacteria bacterium]|nr:saccharopine dehydrogenase NADP-binding domain-containing protein [Actinomycetota bacterium]
MVTNKPLISLVGATGHTAGLILDHGTSRFGFRLIARNPDRLAEVAARVGNGTNWTSVRAIDRAEIARAVEGSAIVINVAGPFVSTATVVAEAAMSVGAAYIDISNERAAVRAVLDLSGSAERAAVPLVPASGFGTVATEGLAAWVADGEPVHSVDVALLPDNEGRTAGALESVLLGFASGGARVTAGRLRELPLGGGARRLSIPGGKTITLVPANLGDLASIPSGYGASEVTASVGVGMPPFAARVVLPIMSGVMRSDRLRRRLLSRPSADHPV